MLLKPTGSTAQARHESWKKRQFEAPHNDETQKRTAVAQEAAPKTAETEDAPA